MVEGDGESGGGGGCVGAGLGGGGVESAGEEGGQCFGDDHEEDVAFAGGVEGAADEGEGAVGEGGAGREFDDVGESDAVGEGLGEAVVGGGDEGAVGVGSEGHGSRVDEVVGVVCDDEEVAVGLGLDDGRRGGDGGADEGEVGLVGEGGADVLGGEADVAVWLDADEEVVEPVGVCCRGVGGTGEDVAGAVEGVEGDGGAAVAVEGVGGDGVVGAGPEELAGVVASCGEEVVAEGGGEADGEDGVVGVVACDAEGFVDDGGVAAEALVSDALGECVGSGCGEGGAGGGGEKECAGDRTLAGQRHDFVSVEADRVSACVDAGAASACVPDAGRSVTVSG